MVESQSGPLLQGDQYRDWWCEILRSAQNDNVVCDRIRRWENNKAWPGQK
jgi:hypothetical protein